MKLRSFASVVSDICSTHLDDDAGKLRGRVARALRNALSEMGAHLSTPIKSGFVTVKDNLTADLPEDLSQVTKVGYSCDGGVALMSRTSDIRRALPEKCSCEGDSSCPSCTFYNVQTLPNQYGEVYSLKGNFFGRAEFRHNTTENRLEFNSIVKGGDKVLVEYKTVGSDESLALIPAEWVNMLGSYVAAQLNTQNRPGVAQAHRAAFQASWNALKAAGNPYTSVELISALMGESMSAPKN